MSEDVALVVLDLVELAAVSGGEPEPAGGNKGGPRQRPKPRHRPRKR